MPKNKRKTSRPKKRGSASNKINNMFGSINSYRIKPEPFPRVMYSRAKFSDRGQMTIATPNVAVSESYRLNSIWDPRFALGGQTVVGHGNLMALYNKYMVLGARIRVSFNDPTVGANRVGCRIRIAGAGATVGKTVQQLAEKPLTYIDGLNNSGSQKKVFNFYVTPWSQIGISKLEYMTSSASYASVMNTDPVEPCYFDIFAVNPINTGNIQFLIQVVYDVKFFDRKDLTSS